MTFCIIPARIGSKRIPKKNIKNFGGKPMIGHAIETALKAESITRVFVSTDDTEVSSISRSFGAEVPFLRPHELADDQTTTKPVIQHFIQALLSSETVPDGASFVCLYPCTPFLSASQVDEGYKMLRETGANFVYPVQEYCHPVQRALRINGTKLSFVTPDFELSRTQDLEKHYFDSGQFYWGTQEAWLSEKNIHSNGHGMVVDGSRLIDIDNKEDWRRAERLYQIL